LPVFIKASAVINPYTNPEQAAFKSKAVAFTALSLS